MITFWLSGGNGLVLAGPSLRLARDNQEGDRKWVMVEIIKVQPGPALRLGRVEGKSGRAHDIKKKKIRIKGGTRVRVRVCLTGSEGLSSTTCNEKKFTA